MFSHAGPYFTYCQVSRNDPKWRNKRVQTHHSHSRGDILGQENGKLMASVKNSMKVPGMSRGAVEPSGCIWLPCPMGGEEPPCCRQAGATVPSHSSWGLAVE